MSWVIFMLIVRPAGIRKVCLMITRRPCVRRREASTYTVRIYNIAGQVVKTIVGQGEAGSYTLIWDGRSDQGATVASGVYFYRAEAGEHTQTRKMLMLK